MERRWLVVSCGGWRQPHPVGADDQRPPGRPGTTHSSPRPRVTALVLCTWHAFPGVYYAYQPLVKPSHAHFGDDTFGQCWECPVSWLLWLEAAV